MITLEREEEIRSRISYMKDREIAEYACVSLFTVRSIREVLDLFYAIPRKKSDEIREMILHGLPNKAIAIRAKVSRKLVLAVKRFYYLSSRTHGGSEPRKCPTCGSMMFSSTTVTERDPCKFFVESIPRKIGKTSVVSLYRLMYNVVELGSLAIIPNPIFYNLACKAKEIKEKIDDEN